MSVETTTEGSVPFRSIWQELEAWSRSFRPWQRLLLSSAVRHGTIPQATLEQAYALFRADFDLARAPDPMPEIPSSVTGRETSGSQRSLLHRVFSPSGINQLPLSAELTFDPGLTVIYGGNGVGKSGFARILANACFSRTQHPIYPDVFDSNAPLAPSASIELVDEGGNVSTLRFDNVAEHAELKRGFAVFDSDVAERHLRDTGPLGFTPAGFDVFQEMARAYASLQAKLAADIAGRKRANTFANAFIGPTTEASSLATNLGRFTNVDAVKRLASFGPEEQARMEVLQTQADHLRAQSPAAEIKRLSDARPHLLKLKADLAQIGMALSEEALASDRRLGTALTDAAAAVARVSADQFSGSGVEGTSSAEWREMISAAQRLARQQHVHYPEEGDLCLLCHQPLDVAARELYSRYASFLASDAPRRFAEISERIATRRAELGALPVAIAEEGSLVHQFLAQAHPSVLAAIAESSGKLAALRASQDAALAGEVDYPAGIAVSDFGGVIDDLVAQLDTDLRRLQQSDVPASLKLIEDDRVALRHREVLSKNLADMLRYVRDEQWIAKAEADARPALNPRHLTEKQTELFATVIAQNYRTQLAGECDLLDCRVPVELRTQGRQGQTVRSLLVGDRPPGDILSEGEQRAVALADFLTETSLNADNIGIIFDDPVTSLDHDRKDRIAARLVKEAKVRQVVVFTHDMVFFAKINDAADKAQVECVTHWMHRSADGKPGVVSPNDAPTTTPQYRKTSFAEDTLAKAKAAVGSTQEELVRKGAGQLRRTVEEIIPQYLFKEVVRRWTDRVIVTGLRKVSWDNGLADEIVDVFEASSAIMEGHSHTEAGAEAPPTPQKLEELIGRTKEVIRRATVQRS